MVRKFGNITKHDNHTSFASDTHMSRTSEKERKSKLTNDSSLPEVGRNKSNRKEDIISMN